MNQGCLIFAHDSDIDYGSQAVLAAKLAHKHLNVPISLVADSQTISSIHANFNDHPFDSVIEVPKPITNNRRNLAGTNIGFINANRASAWELTPYDRTLLLDSDFLIFSDTLNKYWNAPYDFLITPGMLDLLEKKDAKAYKISPYTIDMLWATNIMFTKNESTKILFDLVEHIRSEYEYYAHLYEFNKDQYRNDYAFSIACHILSDHGLSQYHGELAVPLLFKDSDELIEVKENGQLTFLMQEPQNQKNYILTKAKDQDVHIMNKYSLLDNLPKLLELADG
jgi:hypothetical protein